MALGFIPSDAAMLVVQAGVVAAPRRAPEASILRRFSGPAWALIPIGSIIAVVFAIRYVSATATGLTYLALVAVPILAAAALGWADRGARPWMAGLAIPLFILAWADRSGLAGQGAATLLSALSCVTLGVLLAAVTPPRWLKAGILAMAVADAWLVTSDLLQAPNATLVAAKPAGGLPQLQSELFGSVSMGYGDLFVAGLLGAVLAREGRSQGPVALLTLVIAGLFDLLFLVIHELPATVPVALALVATEAWYWRRARRTSKRGAATAAAETGPGRPPPLRPAQAPAGGTGGAAGSAGRRR
jgi:hypothetical protein